MANIAVQLLDNALELATIVTDVALGDPLSALLVLSSTLLWVVAFGLFGYLALGALFSAVIPANIGRTPPQQGE